LRNNSSSGSTTKPPAWDLLNTITLAILSASEYSYLVYNNVGPSAGAFIVDSVLEQGDVERANPRYYYIPPLIVVILPLLLLLLLSLVFAFGMPKFAACPDRTSEPD
jgi:hypothetical protein